MLMILAEDGLELGDSDTAGHIGVLRQDACRFADEKGIQRLCGSRQRLPLVCGFTKSEQYYLFRAPILSAELRSRAHPRR